VVLFARPTSNPTGRPPYAATSSILRALSSTGPHLQDLPQSRLQRCLHHRLWDRAEHNPSHQPLLAPLLHHPQQRAGLSPPPPTIPQTIAPTEPVCGIIYEIICKTVPNTNRRSLTSSTTRNTTSIRKNTQDHLLHHPRYHHLRYHTRKLSTKPASRPSPPSPPSPPKHSFRRQHTV
jgi:hypothetical protein